MVFSQLVAYKCIRGFTPGCRCGNEFTSGTHVSTFITHDYTIHWRMYSCSSRYISRDDEVPDTIYFVPGTVTFIIGFTGCVGALRENTCLLAAVSVLQNSIKLFLDYFNCSTSFGTSNFDWASGSLRDIYGLSLLAAARDWMKVCSLRNVTFKSS